MRLLHSFPTPYHFKPTSLGILRQAVQDRDPRKFMRTNVAVQKTRLRGVTPNSSVELVQAVQEREWEKFRRTKRDSSP
jgi:hypothetical protein